MFAEIVAQVPADRPVLIAGPTASGKSALALAIVEAQGGVVVNADASQIYSCWQVITARPDPDEVARAPHALYGHVHWEADYSTGHWLRDVSALLATGPRPVIVGGTGLYFSALTEGLSQIPPVPAHVRETADDMPLEALVAGLDAPTAAGIDLANRARVQRAFEVLQATGKGLKDWQAETPAPVLPLSGTTALVVDAPKEWLTPRINARFDKMLAGGALDEVRTMLPLYDPSRPAFRAIGVPELRAHLQGEMTLDAARKAVTVATRQYAKRQRTWLRKRCRDWLPVNLGS